MVCLYGLVGPTANDDDVHSGRVKRSFGNTGKILDVELAELAGNDCKSEFFQYHWIKFIRTPQKKWPVCARN